MNAVANIAEHAFRRAVGKRAEIQFDDGERIVGKVLPGLSKPGPYARRFRLRARETIYIPLDLAPRLRILSAGSPRLLRKRRKRP